VDGEQLTLDAYLPAEGDANPVIVAIHGGGFERGDSTRMRRSCLEFAKAGYACFSINYRLAPEYVYPAPVDDLKASIQFIREHSTEYRVDPLRIGTFGVSAGGTVSLSVGAESQSTHSTGWEVAAAASWSGPVAYSLMAFGPAEAEGSEGALPTYIFGDPEADTEGSEDGDPSIPDLEEVKRADPYTHVGKNSAASFLANSSDERVGVDGPRQFVERLRRLRVPNRLQVYEGQIHALGLAPFAQEPTIEFLDEYVRDFTPPTQPPVPVTPGPGEAPGDGGIPVVPIAIIVGIVVLIGALAVASLLNSRRRTWDSYL
jgi:acetyl esterase